MFGVFQAADGLVEESVKIFIPNQHINRVFFVNDEIYESITIAVERHDGTSPKLLEDIIVIPIVMENLWHLPRRKPLSFEFGHPKVGRLEAVRADVARNYVRVNIGFHVGIHLDSIDEKSNSGLPGFPVVDGPVPPHTRVVWQQRNSRRRHSRCQTWAWAEIEFDAHETICVSVAFD